MRRAVTLFFCCFALMLFACGAGPSQQADSSQPSEASIERKALNDYSWDELSRIAQQVASAPTDEEGRQIAQSYGIVEEDGSLTQQTKQIVLNDTRALDVRVAGIRHDDLADGTGKAGITFMTVGALELRPMNDTQTVEGGWEASALRAWLATDAEAMLDDDLRAAIRPVSKLTNNVGRTDNVSSVTATADRMWVFSVHEVCGDVYWDVEEFQQKRGYQDVDGLLNAEGHQYEAFVQAGVTGDSDPNGFLSLAQSTGPSPWWYRTPYPFDWERDTFTGTDGLFYQVRDSGFPKSVGFPEYPAAVVAGFCV